MATIADVPAYHLFMWPIVERLRAKGRSMTIEEMVDGDALCDLLKDRRLGVNVEMVEQVTVDEAAFAAF